MTKSRDLGNLAQTVAVNLPTSLGTAFKLLVGLGSGSNLSYSANIITASGTFNSSVPSGFTGH
jgi:hypothetical protein